MDADRQGRSGRIGPFLQACLGIQMGAAALAPKGAGMESADAFQSPAADAVSDWGKFKTQPLSQRLLHKL